LAGIAAGEYHTCAISDAGNGWCWGDNYYYQLGTGLPYDVAPVQVTDFP
jgi:alpha-tubulin suppressor-like RCC1 family protein